MLAGSTALPYADPTVTDKAAQYLVFGSLLARRIEEAVPAAKPATLIHAGPAAGD
jgi:hypothetical protein